MPRDGFSADLRELGDAVASLFQRAGTGMRIAIVSSLAACVTLASNAPDSWESAQRALGRFSENYLSPMYRKLLSLLAGDPLSFDAADTPPASAVPATGVHMVVGTGEDPATAALVTSPAPDTAVSMYGVVPGAPPVCSRASSRAGSTSSQDMRTLAALYNAAGEHSAANMRLLADGSDDSPPEERDTQAPSL